MYGQLYDQIFIIIKVFSFSDCFLPTACPQTLFWQFPHQPSSHSLYANMSTGLRRAAMWPLRCAVGW